ncbi:MAG: MFS transporter [Terriglobia bacterium]
MTSHNQSGSRADVWREARPGISSARRWWVVILLFIASLINYLDRATISYALPVMSVDFGLDPAKKGLLLSAFFWSYALMQVPTGLIADRFNLRWIYTAAFTLWSLAQGCTGLARSLTVLIVFRILLGVGESIYLPGGTKIVSLLFSRKERGLPSGVFDFGTRTGLFFGGLLIPSLIASLGWRVVFMIVGFAALLWLIPWLAIFPAQIRPAPNHPGSTEEPLASSGSRPRVVTFNRNLLGICLGFFCFDYYWYLMVTWLPDYLVTVRHLTLVKAGLFAALPYLVFGVSEPIGGWIGDRLIHRGWDETRTRKGIVTLAFLTGLLLIPAARVTSARAAVLLLLGASLVGLATGNLLVILQSCAPHEEVGVWTGFENFAGNLGGVGAPWLTGLLIKRTGSYSPGFALAAVVLVSGILAYWFVVGELRPPHAAAGKPT